MVTRKTIAECLGEYRQSDEFQCDFAESKDFAELVGSPETDDDIIAELMRRRTEQLFAEDICERNGHKWHETAYPEDGFSMSNRTDSVDTKKSDLECERCGEFQTISFSA